MLAHRHLLRRFQCELIANKAQKGTNKKRGLEMYEDKTLVCKECGKEFVFTAGEQDLCRARFPERAAALQGMP